MSLVSASVSSLGLALAVILASPASVSAFAPDYTLPALLAESSYGNGVNGSVATNVTSLERKFLFSFWFPGDCFVASRALASVALLSGLIRCVC